MKYYTIDTHGGFMIFEWGKHDLIEMLLLHFDIDITETDKNNLFEYGMCPVYYEDEKRTLCKNNNHFYFI